MKTPPSSVFAAAAVLLAFPPALTATETGLTPSLQFTTGLAGSQNKLTWTTQPGARHRIFSSDGLSSWSARALVEAEGITAMWIDPTPAATRMFYQVEPAQAEVFSVEPAVLAPGAVLVITGQCLPAGSSVVFEIEGIPDVTAPIIIGPDGRMTVTLPAFDLITQPGSGLGPHVKRATVVGQGGALVVVIGQTFEATPSGFANDSPPVMPRFFPRCKVSEAEVNLGAIHKARTSPVPNIPPIPGMNPGMVMLSEPSGLGTFTSIPGEVCIEQCDLELATPAGPSLNLVRTYRSLGGEAGVAGSPGGIACGSWCSNFDIRIEPVPLAAGAGASRLILHSGDGRRNVLVRQADGSYSCDGMFRSGQFSPDTSFTLTFADQSRMIFCPLVGAPWSGRIGSIADRNGVAVTCTYSAAGQLSTVSSQFGQSLTFGYDPAGQLSTATDPSGRFVSFSYYAPGEPGGPPGSLKSASCPTLPGQPPVRGPVVYTYSTGSTDPRLNGNLLTVTGGSGRLVTAWTYSTSTDPQAADYDRAVTCDRFSTDPTEPVVHFSYEFIAQGGGGGGAGGGGAGGLLCITNDELGRVTETRCDRMHRPVSVRAFTTFATPDMPVTSTMNRPPAPVDPTEPAFVEVTGAWNPDHLCTRWTEEDGLQTRITYDRDLRRDCPRRERGNARVVTIVSTDASEAPRTLSMDYLPGFGTVEGGAFLSKKGYDYYQAQSDLSSAGMHNNPAFQDNAHQGEMPGRRMAGPDYLDPDDDDDRIANSPGNPITGLSIKGGRNPGGNVQGRSAGPGDDDDCDGLDDDWTGQSNPIPGVGIVIKRNPRGSSVARAARSHTSFDKTDPMYFLTRLTTPLGQKFTWGHDTRGNCTTSTTPIAGSGMSRTYNSLGQRTGVTVLNGPGSSFHRSLQHDAATHFLTGEVVDPDVNGTGEGLALTTTFGRNPLGLITEVVDPRNNSTLIGHNACDQPVSISSPPLGTDPVTAARVVCTQSYDFGGLPDRCDLQHRDATGTLVAANPYYTGFCIYNSRGLLVMEGSEQKPVDVPPGPVEPALLGLENFDAVEYTPNAAGECVRALKPAVCRDQHDPEVCDSSIDALGRISSITTGGLGTPGAITTEFRYSPSGQVTRASLVLPAGVLRPTVRYTFDGWRRPDTFTDELGTVTSWSYANDGFVTVAVHGKAGDVEGPGPNVLLAQGRFRTGSRVFCGVADRTGSISDGCISDETCGNDELDFSPLGMAINEKGLPGEKGTKPKKSHARMTGGEPEDCDDEDRDFSPGGMSSGRLLPAIQKIREAKARYRPAFFDVFTTDDVWTAERFAPGAPAPHATITTTVHHSPAGLPLSVTRNGDVLYLFGGYDGAGRLFSYSQPGTVTVTGTLDACGNVTASTLTAHSTLAGTPDETFTTASVFDPRNLCTSSTDSTGNQKRLARNSLEHITSVTSPGGLTATYAYDTVSSTGTFSSVVVTTPDADGDGMPDYQASSVCLGGSLRSTTDAAGYTTTFTCDSQNRRTRIEYPDLTFEATTFNDLGHPVSHVRKNGAIISADFDYKAQSTRVTVSNLPPGVVPVPPTEHVWNGLGHCVQSTEGASIVVRLRDSFGNVLSETQNGHTITHTYNHRGCTGTGYSSGEQFSEARNAHGQLLTFSSVTAAGAVPITQRDYAGFACVREERRNGVVTTRDFRSDNEPPLPLGGGSEDFTFGGCVRTTVTGPGGTILENHLIRRNADQCETLHHRAFAEGAAPPSRRQTFTLNARNQVTRCVTHVREAAGAPVIIASDVRYQLDARGQRLSETRNGLPGLYTSSATAPLFDHQMAQYSSWSGGDLEWDANGCLTQLNRTGSSMDIIYDAFSRATEVRDENGLTVATYAYDAGSRRISSTIASKDPATPAVTTFFLYAGSECYQELQEDGGVLVSELTYGVSGGAKHCIITKNGSTYYPNGGGSSETAFVFPILPAWPNRLEEVPNPDPVLTLGMVRPGPGTMPRIGRLYDTSDCSMLTTATGQPHERFASTDSCQPIFLNGDGLPTGASSSSIGYRWLQPGSAWCPESSLFQCTGGLYSPELGQPVSSHKTKPKKEEPVMKASWDLCTNKKV